MNLEDLKKSITECSDEELLSLFREIRANRRTPSKPAAAAPKQKKEKQKRKEESMQHIDEGDSRFQELFTSADFAPDPTHPMYVSSIILLHFVFQELGNQNISTHRIEVHFRQTKVEHQNQIYRTMQKLNP